MFDMTSLDQMVRLAASHFQEAVDDLRDGQKDGHWIWYVMPTSKAGDSQPDNPKIVVMPNQEAEWLDRLEELSLLGDYITILKNISHLQRMPRADQGRIQYFLSQFGGLLVHRNLLTHDHIMRLYQLAEPY